ncbi:MAG: hypothetical protein QW168_01200 [Sulfolobales archaeon]
MMDSSELMASKHLGADLTLGLTSTFSTSGALRAGMAFSRLGGVLYSVLAVYMASGSTAPGKPWLFT